MTFIPEENDFIPHIEWPEESYNDEREMFYASLLHYLGPAEWVAVVPVPAPMGSVRSAIETDCNHQLQPIEMNYDGVAWLVPWSNLANVLPCLFHARRPELTFLTFNSLPDAEAIMMSLQTSSCKPATRLFLFEDDELVEVRGECKPLK